MSLFIINSKSKVDRLFSAAENSLVQNREVYITGVQKGAIKAIVIAEKLKKIYSDVLQTNNIYEKEGNSCIDIKLQII